MECCITKPLSLCPVGTCQQDYIRTGITAGTSGVYSLILSYLSSLIKINIVASSGDSLRFPANGLNENYEYEGYITKPDGTLLSIVDNLITYDGIRFRTVAKLSQGITVAEDNTPIAEAADNATNLQTFLAAMTINSGKAVIVDNNLLYLFNPADISHANRCFGIAKTSGNTGDSITVQTNGIITNAAYNFTIDKPVFIDSFSACTTTIPTDTILLQSVGAAVDIDTLSININQTIKRLL